MTEKRRGAIVAACVVVLAAALEPVPAAAKSLWEAIQEALEDRRNEAVDLHRLYADAIRDAAVKAPSFRKRLMPIDPATPFVRVVTLTDENQVGADGRLEEPVWVSLTSELRRACRGEADPLLGLQQILGLPPHEGVFFLLQFTVQPQHIFRPCASSPSIAVPFCSFELHEPRTPAEAADLAYVQKFVFEQLWTSFDLGLPEVGYPFTGMGWTYNWNPESEDHYGISEYVVRQNARVTNVQEVSPAAFCG